MSTHVEEVEVAHSQGSLVNPAPCGRAYGGALEHEETLSHLYRPAEQRTKYLGKTAKSCNTKR